MVDDEDSRWPDPCDQEAEVFLDPPDAPGYLDAILQGSPCPDDDAEVRRLGLLIDLAEDLHRGDALRQALRRGDDLLKRGDISTAHAATIHYFLGNAWDALRRLDRRSWDLHAWEQPEMEKQFIHLRRAARIVGEAGLARGRECQILTNLGNLLSHCGRVVEAVRLWDQALRRDSAFAMALGNRGYGLYHYAARSHDPGHQLYLLRAAHESLAAALSVPGGIRHPAARTSFEQTRDDIRGRVPADILERAPQSSNFGSDWSPEEREYREWALRHRLFLNDLCELDAGVIAAADVLTLPSLTTPIDAPQPSIIGYLNQMKQEFVSARFVLFEGLHANDVHFSDRDVTLLNTLDYPVYGLPIERVKFAFRIGYSLFDKIAYFLNEYLALGIPESRVSFRSLWYKKGMPRKGLRPEFGAPRNRGLVALFWLAKDLYEPGPDFVEVIEPDAQLLGSLRNHLEHKYLKVHDYSTPSDDGLGVGFESLAYSVTRRDLEAKTVRLLQLARAAMIYLVHSVRFEEDLRAVDEDGDRIVAPMFLDNWDDDWKT